jgi:hypothetical protein
MKKNVMLIDAEGVKKLGYIHGNVLPHILDVTIRRVQTTMLKKVMGKAAYEDLLDKVSASLPPTPIIVPLSPETEELLYDYVHHYIAAAVDYKIVLPLTIELRSKAAGKSSDENFDPAELKELIRLRDQFKQDLASYAEDLKEYLAGECEDETTGGSASPTSSWNNIKFK